MPETKITKLISESALRNFQTQGDEEFLVEEVKDLNIVCAYMPDVKNAEKTLMDLYSMPLPEIGKSCFLEGKKIHFLRTNLKELFILFEEKNCFDCFSFLPMSVHQDFYLTEQSDAFAVLRAKGKQVFERLKFISALNLDNFSVGNITRSLIDHQGHYIMLETESSFLFLTPRSSAYSFARIVAQLCFLR